MPSTYSECNNKQVCSCSVLKDSPATTSYIHVENIFEMKPQRHLSRLGRSSRSSLLYGSPVTAEPSSSFFISRPSYFSSFDLPSIPDIFFFLLLLLQYLRLYWTAMWSIERLYARCHGSVNKEKTKNNYPPVIQTLWTWCAHSRSCL